MNSLIYIYLICAISVSNGEQWYSASLLESNKPLKTEDLRRNVIQDYQNFEPIKERLSNVEYSADDNKWPFEKQKLDKFKYNSREINTNKSRTRTRRRCPESCSQTKNRRLELSTQNRTKTRFLEVFQVVKFDNDPCFSSSGLEGTCLHEYECQSLGGTGMGSCADGYGMCCIMLLPCESKSSAPMGWFTNPDYPLPSNDRLTCAIALSKSSDDVTQIRLDFITFELLPPTDGICQEDQFVVSGQNVNNLVPILCGINTGQHVYIEVGEAEGPIYLLIQTANPENRLFSIKVSQLTPSDDLIAPPGCLQYYTEPKAEIESFNYRDKSDISGTRSTSYLNNLNYAMCINRVAGSCSVTYTNVGYLQIVNYDADGLPVIPPGQAGVEVFSCPGDWLLLAATRLCGERLNDGALVHDFSLNAPITDNSAGPIVVWFRSDEGYVGRGFKLQYKQNACTVK